MVIRGSGPNLIGELITQSPELVFLIQICSIILPIRVVAFSHPFHPACLGSLVSGSHDRHRILVVFVLCQHGPNLARHLVG
jgi:hypothetical protein